MFLIFIFCFLFVISNSPFFLPLVRDGFLLWYQQLLPALFPAMIFTNLILTNVSKEHTHNLVNRITLPLCRLFGVSQCGLFVIFLGFLGGFPIGAFLVGRLCVEHRISNNEGQHLLHFTNNIGPAYFLGVVFPAFFKVGVAEKWILLLSFLFFYLIPLLDGILFARIPSNTEKILYPAIPLDATPSSILLRLDNAITNAIQSIVKLAGYVVFFRLFLILPALFSLSGLWKLIFISLIEITTGIRTWQDTPILNGIFLLPFLSFGGLSCIAQTYCMIRGCNLSLLRYLLHKLIQSLLLTGILLILLSTPV